MITAQKYLPLVVCMLSNVNAYQFCVSSIRRFQSTSWKTDIIFTKINYIPQHVSLKFISEIKKLLFFRNVVFCIVHISKPSNHNAF